MGNYGDIKKEDEEIMNNCKQLNRFKKLQKP